MCTCGLAFGGLLIVGSYVDEIQDSLLIDAYCKPIHTSHFVLTFLVLRSICRNPKGLFWAGDTAQTISVGSVFRFNELRSFLYRVEVGGLKDQLLRSHAKGSFRVHNEIRARILPAGCELSISWRHH